MSDQTINANIAECLRQANHLGSTTVYNVCSGATFDVPWGGVDWLVFVGVSSVVLAFVVLMLLFAFMMLREW